MQAVSSAYKAAMEKPFRDRTYMRVVLGLVNHDAQSSAYIPNTEDCAYYSNVEKPFDNYSVDTLYVSTDNDWSSVDGSMYFLPRKRLDVVLNQGIVTREQMGEILIRFRIPFEIKGLTIDFGKAYPTDFRIESDNNTVTIEGNADSRFSTDEIFHKTTFLKFIPIRMVNGASRFRIHMITMGVGVYFNSNKIISAHKRDYISPIMEELPTIDFELTINNKDRAFDIENSKSSVNFLNIGQEVSVHYGQELEDGSVFWQQGGLLRLRQWSADDIQMAFTATDRFEDLNQVYCKGIVHLRGISLYNLALEVLQDANVDARDFWLDEYLKKVVVCNPLPVVTHKEALQIIANAGRCILGQDRYGKIFIQSSFLPDMTASSDNATYFSKTENVLLETDKMHYALTSPNYTKPGNSQFFLPREGREYLATGYISQEVADSVGEFKSIPVITIRFESKLKLYGISLLFDENFPQEMEIVSYLNDVEKERFSYILIEKKFFVNHEFPELDKMEIRITRGRAHHRVVLDVVKLGKNTDYRLRYGYEMMKTPKGTQLSTVKEVQVVRSLYYEGVLEKEIAKEQVQGGTEHIFYFTNPMHNISAACKSANVNMLESSCFFAKIRVDGSGLHEVIVTGIEYIIMQSNVSKQLNPTGSIKIWENPLLSDEKHASALADWVGAYMKSDREYDIEYRGEPRIDSNDIMYLENKYVDDLLLRVYSHTLRYNGALSGTIKARRDVEYVADT